MLQVDPASVGGGGWVLSWDAGSARAAGFAKGTGRQVPPALPGLSHPWVTPTGRHLHDADEVPAANVQWEGGKSRVGARLWRGGPQVDDNATGRLWQLAAQIELQAPTLAPCIGLCPP